MAKKKYIFKGSSPILVDGYGRIEPHDEPHEVVCDMSPKQEKWFLKIGSIDIVSVVPDEVAASPLEKPSTAAWLQKEITLDEYPEEKE